MCAVFRFVHINPGILQSSKEHVRSPGATVTGSCEAPGMGAGNQSPVLGKSSRCSALQGGWYWSDAGLAKSGVQVVVTVGIWGSKRGRERVN